MKVQEMLTLYRHLLEDVRHVTGIPLGDPVALRASWLLIEAPKLDQQLLQFIEYEGSGFYPEFPQWLKPLWQAFIREDKPEYLMYLRTLLVFCYKIEQEPTKEQINEAIKNFKDNEEDMQTWNRYFNPDQDLLFRFASRTVSQVIANCNWQEIEPSHGPGAVFPPCPPVTRSRQCLIPRLHSLYPHDIYCVPLPSWHRDVYIHNGGVPEYDPPASLTFVPKDSRGPRTICVHPKELIWIQKGQQRLLESAISQSLGSFINFEDQTVNGTAAQEASIDRYMCTIDLKDASDRLPEKLVSYLFGSHYKYLAASRADRVAIGEEVLALEKYAPMGNATTFPVESLCFYAIVRAGIELGFGRAKALRTPIYVFGDDIIVPTKTYDAVMYALIRCGLKPNPNKCFRRGFFRESCGIDAYKGVNVTPLRLKKANYRTPEHAVGMCDLAKRLIMHNLSGTAEYIYGLIEQRWGVLDWTTNPDCQGLIRYTEQVVDVLKYSRSLRYNEALQIFETKTRLWAPVIDRSYKHSWWNVADSIRKCGTTDRGLEYPVPYQGRLQYGWTQVV